jgi:hypothetical protein
MILPLAVPHGTALVGSILVAVAYPAGRPFLASFAVLGVTAVIGLGLGVLLPRQR